MAEIPWRQRFPSDVASDTMKTTSHTLKHDSYSKVKRMIESPLNLDNLNLEEAKLIELFSSEFIK